MKGLEIGDLQDCPGGPECCHERPMTGGGDCRHRTKGDVTARQSRSGVTTSPGSRSRQQLEGQGRVFSWSLRRVCGPADTHVRTPAPRTGRTHCCKLPTCVTCYSGPRTQIQVLRSSGPSLGTRPLCHVPDGWGQGRERTRTKPRQGLQCGRCQVLSAAFSFNLQTTPTGKNLCG